MSAREPILSKATGAGNSDDVFVDKIPVTLSIYPEANYGTDKGDLKMKNADNTYDKQYLLDGTQIQLSSTLPSCIVTGGGIFRIEFSARNAAIGASKQDAPKGY